MAEGRRGVRMVAVFVALWAITAALMTRSYLQDPYDPSRTGTSAYGHNHQGALLHGLGLSLVELIVLLAVLRPWSYLRAWPRALGALALLVPWTGLSALLTMHAGGVVALHLAWLLVLVGTLFGLAIWSAVSAVRS